MWRSIGADEAAARIKHISLGLFSLGVRPGERVALLCENRPEWTMMDLGILSIGAVVVPIYTTQLVSQIEFIFSNSEPKLVVISNRALYDRAFPALEKFDLTRKLIVFETVPPIPHAITLDDLESAGKKAAEEPPGLYDELKSKVKPGDLATIVYTYSESGEPKGVMLTHKNMVSNVLTCSALFKLHPVEDVALSYLPLSHVFERMAVYHYLYRQIQIYYAESVEKVADNLVQVKPTVMTTVPRLLEKFEERMVSRAQKLTFIGRRIFNWCMSIARKYDPGKTLSFFEWILHAIADFLLLQRLRKRLGGRLRIIISGGARLKAELGKIFAAAGVFVLQGYGLTETSPVIAANTLERNRIGSVGPVIPGVSVKIADDGEILVNGPNVMEGYYKNPEATQKVFDGSWFRTGDVGYLDQDGFLYVTDRKKDLMKTSGGKYVAPQVIEGLLEQNEYVDKAVVIGEGRKFVSALIVPNLEKLKELAAQNNLQDLGHKELAHDPIIKKFYEGIINKVNQRLSQWETVRKFAIVGANPGIGEEAGLSPRTRRKKVEEQHRDIVESFYVHGKDERNVPLD